MTTQLDPHAFLAGVRRWALLTGARLADDAKPLGLAAAVVAGLNLVTLVLFRETVIFGSQWSFLVAVGSVLVASSVFRTMHTGRSTTDFLLWPATSLEKYGAALAEALVAVPLGLTLVATVLSVVFGGLGALVGSSAGDLWLPWTRFSWSGVAAFEVSLLVLVTGAATFRKHALWKTALVVLGASVAVAVLALVVVGTGRGGLWSWGHGSFGFIIDEQAFHGHHVGPVALGALQVIAQLWYFGVVPVFCLVFGWAQVHEKEAKDEVQ